MREATPHAVYLKDYLPPEYLIHSIDLNFSLDEANTKVTSRMLLERNPNCRSGSTVLALHGEELLLDSVSLDGQALDEKCYQQHPDKLLVNNVPQEQVFVLEIENRINPGANTALEGLYLSSGMLCTQCEAQGFRKITYFLDRPDVMTRFTTTMMADKDKYPVLLSNGNKVAAGELPNNRHWVSWEDPFCKSSYLFALVAGQLECVEDEFITQSGRRILLQIFVEKHDLDKCAHAMQSLKDSMRWDEQVYGREYDLDRYMIVAVSHFNMGAMENKGLNVFNTKYVLARPDTATDADYEHIQGVIAHEYFHNWTGNRITCRDWFQLSLKEGLTVFRDQEFTADHTSRAVKRIEDVNMLRSRQFAEDAGPLAHPVRPDSYIEINNFYTLTVYEKGAEVVRMIHTLLGAEGFRKGMDLYFHRHDGQAVTCDDFVKAMADANDADLNQFQLWYSQAGTPEIVVVTEYEPESKTLLLTLSQSCPATPGQAIKKPLHIPVKIGFIGSNGMELPVHLQGDSKPVPELTLDFTEKQQTYRFQQLTEKPVVSLLRGFSAPVKLKQQQSLEELAFLLNHDSDTFNRWEAGQSMAVRIILDLVEDQQQQREMVLNSVIIEAFGHLLDQSWEDLTYLSLLLTLPTENYLAEQMAVVDVEAIHQAREFVQQSLTAAMQQKFLDWYQRNHKDESGQFDVRAVGCRRIKNTCLGYLHKQEENRVYQLAEQQFETARNMTDQIAALGVIVNSHNPAKERCLQMFFQKWQDEPLVIDKWFTIQATSSSKDCFGVVTRLLQHSAFDLKNPNRVRALIGAFCQANQLRFHAANGQGYTFLADQVIALDTINPQVAARMAGALTQWRRFDQNRQGLMRSQLERIIKTGNISADVFEVASKSLS